MNKEKENCPFKYKWWKGIEEPIDIVTCKLMNTKDECVGEKNCPIFRKGVEEMKKVGLKGRGSEHPDDNDFVKGLQSMVDKINELAIQVEKQEKEIKEVKKILGL